MKKIKNCYACRFYIKNTTQCKLAMLKYKNVNYVDKPLLDYAYNYRLNENKCGIKAVYYKEIDPKYENMSNDLRKLSNEYLFNSVLFIPLYFSSFDNFFIISPICFIISYYYNLKSNYYLSKHKRHNID